MTAKLFLLHVVGLTLCGPSALLGATITVTNTNDTGAGSLRATLASAVSGDTIDFNLSLPATITLASELVPGNKSLVIQGPGANQLTISGNNAVRVFRINPINSNQGSTFSGLTIANGRSTGSGGGIELASGSLTLSNCVVTNNNSTAPTGAGAVLARAGTRLNVIDSTISNNVSAGRGGGIGTDSSGPPAEITLSGSTVSGNTAIDGGGIASSGTFVVASSRITGNSANISGGGVYNTGTMTMQGGSIDANQMGNLGEGGGVASTGSLTLTETSVTGNVTTSNSTIGGGIHNSGSCTAIRCTISGNAVAGKVGSPNSGGGGIYNSGTLTISNSTVSGNSTTTNAGVGGGIYNAGSSSLTISSSTIAFNSAALTGGGGVVSSAAGATATCRNSIIARNTSSNSNNGPDVLGTFVTQGFNLIGNANGSTGFTDGQNRDQVGSNSPTINPLLDPLADNGGPTKTHALQSSSPALDRGSPALGVVTDQRGFPRFRKAPSIATVHGSGNSDIGAFEYANSTLRITSITRPANGHILLEGIGLPNAAHSVQASAMPDGSSFLTIAPIFSDATGNLQYDDAEAASLDGRIYRFTFP